MVGALVGDRMKFGGLSDEERLEAKRKEMGLGAQEYTLSPGQKRFRGDQEIARGGPVPSRSRVRSADDWLGAIRKNAKAVGLDTQEFAELSVEERVTKAIQILRSVGTQPGLSPRTTAEWKRLREERVALVRSLANVGLNEMTSAATNAANVWAEADLPPYNRFAGRSRGAGRPDSPRGTRGGQGSGAGVRAQTGPVAGRETRVGLAAVTDEAVEAWQSGITQIEQAHKAGAITADEYRAIMRKLGLDPSVMPAVLTRLRTLFNEPVR